MLILLFLLLLLLVLLFFLLLSLLLLFQLLLLFLFAGLKVSKDVTNVYNHGLLSLLVVTGTVTIADGTALVTGGEGAGTRPK